MSNTATIPMVPEQDAYSVAQVAKRIGRSAQFVRNLINDGKLNAVRDDRAIFIFPSEVQTYLRNLENERP